MHVILLSIEYSLQVVNAAAAVDTDWEAIASEMDLDSPLMIMDHVGDSRSFALLYVILLFYL